MPAATLIPRPLVPHPPPLTPSLSQKSALPNWSLTSLLWSVGVVGRCGLWVWSTLPHTQAEPLLTTLVHCEQFLRLATDDTGWSVQPTVLTA